MQSRLAAVILTGVLVAGCTVGPNYKRPTVAPPPAYRGLTANEAQAIVDLAWFEQFNETSLTALVRSSLDGNLDLMQAIARVEEFRARAAFARASLFPDVRYRFTTTQLAAGQRAVDNSYQAGLTFAWEIDFFGKLRRLAEAARGELLSSEDGARAVMASLVTDVAQTWIDLRRLDRQRAIILDNIKIQEESLRLVRELLSSGVTSALEEQQAINQLATTRSQLPPIELATVQGENFLNLLLGRPPGTVDRPDASTRLPAPPSVPAGLPSALLERRPDIRGAENDLRAATARIGVAVANRFPFPTISLTSLLGSVSAELGDLFTGNDTGTGLFSVGPNVDGSLFDFGRGKASERIFRMQAEQAAIFYRQTILVALREVADAIVAGDKTRETLVQQEVRVSSAGENLRLSAMRFRAGVSSYLEVLDAQRQLLAAQLDLETTRRDELSAAIDLYRAIGGGWSDDELQKLSARPLTAVQ